MDEQAVGTMDDYHHGKSFGLDGITGAWVHLVGTTGRHLEGQGDISKAHWDEAQTAIQGAKDKIELAEEMDQIMFYSKALGLLLLVRDGHSGPNQDMVLQLVKDKIKAAHPFPYVDKC